MRRRRRATMRARRVGARLAHARGHRCAHTTVKSNRARYREGRAHRDTRVCSLPAENIGNRGNSREERWNKLAELCTWYYRVTGNTVTVPVFRVVHHRRTRRCLAVEFGCEVGSRVRTEPASPMPCMPISFGRVPSFPWQSHRYRLSGETCLDGRCRAPARAGRPSPSRCRGPPRPISAVTRVSRLACAPQGVCVSPKSTLSATESRDVHYARPSPPPHQSAAVAAARTCVGLEGKARASSRARGVSSPLVHESWTREEGRALTVTICDPPLQGRER